MMSLPEQFLKLIALLFHDFTCYFTYFVTVARSLSRKLDKEKIHIGFSKRPDSIKSHILSHMQVTTKGETQHRKWLVSLHPMMAAVQKAMEHTIRQTVSAPTFPLHSSSYLALLHWQLKNLLPNSRERRGNFRHLHLSQQQYMLVWTNVSRKCKKYVVGILTLPVQKITVKLQKLGVGVGERIPYTLLWFFLQVNSYSANTLAQLCCALHQSCGYSFLCFSFITCCSLHVLPWFVNHLFWEKVTKKKNLFHLQLDSGTAYFSMKILCGTRNYLPNWIKFS